MSSITADSFQAAQKAACECLWQGNALIQTADQEPTEHLYADGTTSRVFRLACEIESFCKMLDANKGKIPLVHSYLLLVTNGPYEHERLQTSTAHQLAWDFAHRLWLGVYNVLNTQSILTGRGWYEGVPGGFTLDRDRLDANWEPIRDRLRKVKPIDAGHFTRLVQIESARSARAYQDQGEKARVAAAMGVTGTEVKAQSPLFVVNHWRELAIGIDDQWRYWAKMPAPAADERFKKADACKLELPGKRWKTLLELLAESPSGNYCDMATLIRELGYLPPTSSLPRDARARQGHLERDLTSDLPQQIATSLNRLKDTVSDLARDLREQIKGPKGRDQKAALRVDGQAVRSGFVVGFLVPDDEGHLIFRHQLS